MKDLDDLTVASRPRGLVVPPGRPAADGISIEPSPTDRLYVTRVKPVIDSLVAGALVLALAPVMIALAVAVAVSMGRPVLFRQQRVGYRGQPFTILKFRTMKADRRLADVPYDGPDRRRSHKVATDPRITGVGRFLRTWSLDELPQLFNVLFGQMSLVGPRPELPAIVSQYAAWQHHRHLVRPGLTGLWQISERGDKPLHECTEMDIEYVNRVSLRTDAEILLRTPLAAFGGRKGF